MNPASPHERTLTQLDHARLSRLLSTAAHSPLTAAGAMQDVLDSSELVPSPQIPATVVTMHTRVLLEDLQLGDSFEISLCYPGNANASRGEVSVLSPIGWALLGLRAGQSAHWRTPTGEQRSARIVAVLFQPEAAGDYLR